MEAIAEAQLVQEEQKVTNEIVLILGKAIIDLLESTPTVNGKMLYALGKNESKFESIAKQYRQYQFELLEKYVEKNEDNSFKILTEEEANGNPNRFVFKGEDEEQKYESKMTEYLKAPIEIELHKVDKALFEILNINPQKNRSFTIMVDFLSK
tara:strand:- start:77 stop:535 length:459 start_codon:yes stop_codon:yes gene_type:complete